jgi:hypothetical protein
MKRRTMKTEERQIIVTAASSRYDYPISIRGLDDNSPYVLTLQEAADLSKDLIEAIERSTLQY